MPLTAFIEEHAGRVRAFLDDPGAILLEMRAPAEQQPVLARLLVGLAESTEHLFLAADDAESAEALRTNVEATLADAIAQAKPVFAAEGIAFAPPSPPPGLVGMVRTAVLAELAARSWTPFVEGLVVVVRAPPNATFEAFATGLVQLVHALESGRVKLIVLTDERAPSVVLPVVPRPRLGGIDPRSVSLAAGLKGALAAPLGRVAVVDARGMGSADSLRREIHAAADGRDWVVVVEGLFFWKALAFYAEAARSVVWQCHTRCAARGPELATLPLVAEIQNPVGYVEAEAYFAELVERVADAVVPPDGRLLVALCPILEGPTVPPTEVAAFRVSLERLKEAAVSPRVAYVGVGPGLAGPDATLPARVARTQSFRLDVETLEASLGAHCDRPDISLRERQRCTSALAAFAMGRGDPDRGLALHGRAVDLARELASPSELAAARYALGGALYQCAALGYALAQYTEAVEVALAADNALLAAQGLLGMGNCYLVGNQPERALECYAPARTYFARLGNPLSEAHALTWLAEAHARAGDLENAARAFHAALAATDRAVNVAPDAARSSRTEVLQRLAQLYANAGLPAESRACQDQALALGALAPPSPEP